MMSELTPQLRRRNYYVVTDPCYTMRNSYLF